MRTDGQSAANGQPAADGAHPPSAGVTVQVVASFSAGAASDLHDLARAFHDGDAAALQTVARLVAAAVAEGRDWLPAGPPAAVVVVPGHRPGARNPACIALAVRLAAILGWPGPTPGVLERTAPSPEGRSATARVPAEEAGTLRWDVMELPSEGPVLLLDDVTRTGATLAAAVLAAPPSLAGRLVPVAVFRALTPAAD